MNQNFDIKIGNRLAKIKILKQDGSKILFDVDGKKYEVDIAQVDAGYSILWNQKSYNVEILESEDPKHMVVNTLHNSFEVDIVDAEYRYLESRNKNKEIEGGNVISSPMPGRVVRILVKEGDAVTLGQTVIIVSAMKMESEYKATKDGVIKHVHVKEGEVVNGHQPLITIE
ncbi:MAG: biotin/lipoyl-binding protein [Bacteroidales bacterium]|nr:biotin/lipoyl-binding protein [Bacteroidales bacterium]